MFDTDRTPANRPGYPDGRIVLRTDYVGAQLAVVIRFVASIICDDDEGRPLAGVHAYIEGREVDGFPPEDAYLVNTNLAPLPRGADCMVNPLNELLNRHVMAVRERVEAGQLAELVA